MEKKIVLDSVTRRDILRGGAAVAVSSLLPKMVYGQSQPPVTAGTAQSAAITVTVPTSPITLPARYIGLSYEKDQIHQSLFTSSNTELVNLFKLLGPQGGVLRIGGNSVDWYQWTPGGAGGVQYQVCENDVDRLVGFLQQLPNWQSLYGINLGGSGTVTSPHLSTNTTLALQEVTYVENNLKTTGSNPQTLLLAIEMGNEPDDWGSTFYPGTSPAWSLSQYEPLWVSYQNAIYQGVGGVAGVHGIPYAATDAGEWNAQLWTVPFGNYANTYNHNIKVATQHYYIGSPTGVTVTNLVQWCQSNSSPGHAGNVYDFVTYYVGNSWSSQQNQTLFGLQHFSQSSLGVPYRIGELNSYYDGGASQVSNAYASALWAIDFLFTAAMYNCSGVNFQGGGNTGHYTPLSDNGSVITAVNPLFYGMKFFTMALGTSATTLATLNTTTVSIANNTTPSLNLTAYCVTTVSGMSVVISNKEVGSYFNISMTVPGAVSSANLIQMTSSSLSNLSGVTIQGATIGTDGSFSPGSAYTLSYSHQANGTTIISCQVAEITAVLINILF